MKCVLLFCILASVAAFSPAGRTSARSSSSLQMGDFSKEIGVQAPLGFWDPLGLLMNAEQERFDYLREAELKHGRVSMLAILGHIVTTAGARLPGDIAYGLPFASMKTGLAAFDTIPSAGIFQTVAFIGLIEFGFAQCKEELEEYCAESFPAIADERRMAIELNNGRAAQMGILALMVHEKLDNNPYMINGLLGLPVAFNQ